MDQEVSLWRQEQMEVESLDYFAESASVNIYARNSRTMCFSLVQGQQEELWMEILQPKLQSGNKDYKTKIGDPAQFFEKSEGQGESNMERKRGKDGHQFAQNLSSAIMTIIGKNLSLKTGNKVSKEEKELVIELFQKFLTDNKVKKNNQLIVAFFYLYLVSQQVNKECIRKIKEELLSFFEKRLKKLHENSSTQDMIEKNYELTKLMTNREIMENLFDSGGLIDTNKLLKMASPLYNKKQEKKIMGQILKLECIQRDIDERLRMIQNRFQGIWQQ